MANVVWTVLWTQRGWLYRHCLVVGWLVTRMLDWVGKNEHTLRWWCWGLEWEMVGAEGHGWLKSSLGGWGGGSWEVGSCWFR